MPGVSNVDGWARSFSFSLKIVVLLTEQTNFFSRNDFSVMLILQTQESISLNFLNQFFVHAIVGYKDRVLWIANLILNISYFVGVNQVHYFPYVFYTCLAGNCIVDKNCLFSLVRRKTEQLRSRWTCTQFKLVYFEERRTTPLSHHRFFLTSSLLFHFFGESRASRASPRTNVF